MPTAVLPPGLDALLRAARAPSYESPYPGLEGISPEEMAIAGMPGVADIMLKREAMAGQRAGLGGQHALGLSELAEQSMARQVADSLAQQKVGLGFGELASRSQLGNRGLDVQQQELGLKGEMAQMADLISRAKLGIEAQRVSQEGALGEGELALRGRTLEQSLMPRLLQAMGQYEYQSGAGALGQAKAAELLKALGGREETLKTQEATGSGNILNYILGAGALYGGYRYGKGKGWFGKGAKAADAAGDAAKSSVPASKTSPTIAETAGEVLPAASPAEAIAKELGGFTMGAGETTVAPVWMRGAHQPASPIDDVLEGVFEARQTAGPRAPMGSGPRQFGPPAVIGGGPVATTDEAKRLLVAKILEQAFGGRYTDPHVAGWLEQFAR